MIIIANHDTDVWEFAWEIQERLIGEYEMNIQKKPGIPGFCMLGGDS